MSKPIEIYVSVDIEADGPIPGRYSMLSLGAAAYRPDGASAGEFSANLEVLPGAETHPVTMDWWAHFPEAWAVARTDPRPPKRVMTEFADWLESLPGVPIFVGWPANWDFMWVYWYLMEFTGRRPFAEHAIDIRSYAMGVTGRRFSESTKPKLPRRWDAGLPHTHKALDDAKEQGAFFLNMVRENQAAEREQDDHSTGSRPALHDLSKVAMQGVQVSGPGAWKPVVMRPTMI